MQWVEGGMKMTILPLFCHMEYRYVELIKENLGLMQWVEGGIEIAILPHATWKMWSSLKSFQD
jgi:hypothetical protein